MAVISLVLGIFSLLYGFFIIILYGFFTTQNYIWLIIALAFFFISYITKKYSEDSNRVPLRLVVAVNVLSVTVIIIFMVTQLLNFLVIPDKEEKKLDYLIVLGGDFRFEYESGDIDFSGIGHRLDKAILYLLENKNTMVILSGDAKKSDTVSDAELMADYLMAHGIEKERILLEIQAQNTREGIIYSKALLEKYIAENRKSVEYIADENLWPVLVASERPKKVGILTNNFHIFRAMEIAGKQQFDEVYPVVAGSDKKIYLHMAVREMFLILKDKFLGYY